MSETAAPTAAKTAAKPGWKTTEFYVSLAAMILPFAHTSLPPTWQAALATGAGVVYALARALTKIGITK